MFQPSNLAMKTSNLIVQVHGINTQLDSLGPTNGSGAKPFSEINSKRYDMISNQRELNSEDGIRRRETYLDRKPARWELAAIEEGET